MKTMVFLAMLVACALPACGGDDSGTGAGGGGAGGASSGAECGEHPLSCASGETCWFASDATLTCQPSGSAQAGESCLPLVGQATCSDGLLCVKAGDGDGVCTKLCDPGAVDCGALLCVLVQTAQGAETHICH